MMFDGYLHTYLANLANPSYLDLAIYLSINPSIYLILSYTIYLLLIRYGMMTTISHLVSAWFVTANLLQELQRNNDSMTQRLEAEGSTMPDPWAARG